MEFLSDHLYIEPQAKAEAEAREAKARRRRQSHRRHFAAAKVNRLNADWTTRPLSINWSLYRDLAILRARARQMAKDAPHFRRFIEMCKSNIIGPKGIQLQCRARVGSTGELNVTLNKLVEERFWEWTFRETCSLSGKLNWLAAQRLFVETLVRDGEVLVQHVAANNRFGYALKFWNVDYLDESFNEELPDGRQIIMSVEIDKDRRPVAYHLTTPASEINFERGRVRTRVRIPAAEMTHAFLVTDDESQVRGVTWFAAALLQGKHLHEYTGSVLEQARVAASSLGFLEKDDADELEYEGETEEGYAIPVDIDVAPLSMNELPAGYRLNQFDPKQPTQNHTEFKQSMLMDLAAAMGVNYFSLAGDLSSVNYSSARVGLGEERDLWRALQEMVSDTFCREVYHRWLQAAFQNDVVRMSPHQFRELQNPMWRPRGWRYVDPHKEIGAHVTAIENKLTSYTDVLADLGIDLTEHLETLSQEQKLAAEMGIDLNPASARVPPPAPDEDEDDGDDRPTDDAASRFTNGVYDNRVN